MRLVLPRSLVSSLVDVHGPAGAAWLGELPALVGTCAQRWQLRLLELLPGGYHVVIAARGPDGRELVLKLGPPGTEGDRERTALRAAAGHGLVAVEADDPGLGAILLRRALPGGPATTLVPGNDAAATAALAGVARRLAAAPAGGVQLPHVGQLGGTIRRGRAAGLPADLADAALGLLPDLLAGAGPDVLLHGDLHHGNVVRDATAPDGWLGIDPHGWLGERAFEASGALYNPIGLGRRTLLRLLPSRLEQWTSELDAERDRVLGWGVVKAAVSEAWTLEGHGKLSGVPLAVGRRLLELA
jgi:streptomycin 6-kinase